MEKNDDQKDIDLSGFDEATSQKTEGIDLNVFDEALKKKEPTGSKSSSASGTSKPVASGSAGYKFEWSKPKPVTGKPVTASERSVTGTEYDNKVSDLDSKIQSGIVDVSQKLNKSREILKSQTEELKGLEDQLNDPMIDDQAKAGLADQYKSLSESKAATETFEKTMFSAAVKLQEAKATASKIAEEKARLENKEFGGAGTAFLKHLYNAFPDVIQGVGSLVESAGDIGEEMIAPEKKLARNILVAQHGEDKGASLASKLGVGEDDKLTDVIGDAIQSLGEKFKVGYDEEDNKHEIASIAGDVIGSVATTLIPAKYLGTAGKVGEFIAGAGTATAQTASGIYDDAKKAGLNDEQAAYVTLGIAAPSGVLEMFGAKNLIDQVGARAAIKQTAKELIEKTAEGKLTKQAILDAASATFKDVAKLSLKSGAKSAAEEGVTEGLQQEVEEAGKNISDVLTGKESFGNKVFSVDAQKNVLFSAAIGAVAGGALGTVFGRNSDNKPLYNKVIEMKNNPKELQRFSKLLDDQVAAGEITKEQSEKVRKNINAMMDADEAIPETIKNNDKRFKAVELIVERNAIKEEISGQDNAFTTKKRERINEINEELQAIAENREYKPKAEENPVEKPVEKKTESKSEPVTVGLSEEEQAELDELSADRDVAKLPAKDEARYQELQGKKEAKAIIAEAEDIDAKSKFETSVDLYYKAIDESGPKSRRIAAERRKFMEDNPTIKYVDDNMKSIYKQLEDQGILTKSGECP